MLTRIEKLRRNAGPPTRATVTQRSDSTPQRETKQCCADLHHCGCECDCGCDCGCSVECRGAVGTAATAEDHDDDGDGDCADAHAAAAATPSAAPRRTENSTAGSVSRPSWQVGTTPAWNARKWDTVAPAKKVRAAPSSRPRIAELDRRWDGDTAAVAVAAEMAQSTQPRHSVSRTTRCPPQVCSAPAHPRRNSAL